MVNIMESRSFYDDVLQCMCLVRCVWIHTLGYASFFVVSIKLLWFFARVWINTSLNTQALILAPDNLLLFSLPDAVGVSQAQKRWCTRLSLTPECACADFATQWWRRPWKRSIDIHLCWSPGALHYFWNALYNGEFLYDGTKHWQGLMGQIW
jgi:hypothetical protein